MYIVDYIQRRLFIKYHLEEVKSMFEVSLLVSFFLNIR